MPDITQQLEEGKKIQEENGIDTDSLRTKISSEEEKDKRRSFCSFYQFFGRSRLYHSRKFNVHGK